MTSHTTSLELSQRLKELGVPQKSEFYWLRLKPINEKYKEDINIGTKQDVGFVGYDKDFTCSAFLASELMEMMPKGVLVGKGYGGLYFSEYDYRSKECKKDGITTPQDALALLYIYLLEQGLI